MSDMTLRKMSVPQKGQLDYWDRSFPSFGVRVSQGGSKTFVLKMHNARRTLGRYGIISLAEAREQARLILAEKTLGKVRPQSVTYEKAVQLFLDDKARDRKPRTIAEYKRLLGRLIFHGQVSEISFDEVGRKLAKFKHPTEHFHLVVALRVFFNWCIKRRYATANPTVGISTKKPRKRKRILTDVELIAIWEACSDTDNDLPAYYRDIVKLLIVTGQRRGEIAALKRSYYSHNQQTICLPSELTKNGREHTFPLGELASSLIPRVDGLFFPARGKIAKPFNGWSKSKTILNELVGFSDWTLHDLRRTFKTNLSRLGVAPHVSERLLNHVSARDPLEETYDLYTYMPEMRGAVDKYDAFLTQLVAPQ